MSAQAPCAKQRPTIIGAFIVTNLLPARYSVLAEAQGFAKLEQQVDLPRAAGLLWKQKLQVGKVKRELLR